MQTKGFVGSLLDFSFRSMITPRIIKLVYALTMIVIGLWYVGLVLLAFAVSPVPGALMLLVGGPLIALVQLIWTRMILETAVAQFRIMESAGELVTLGRIAIGGPSGGAPGQSGNTATTGRAAPGEVTG